MMEMRKSGTKVWFVALLACLTLALSAAFMAATVSEAQAVTGTFDLSKNLRMAEGTPAPNVTFTFDFARRSFNGSTEAAQLARIPEISPRTVTPTTAGAAAGGVVTLSGSTNALAGITFTEAGIYSWTVTERVTATGVGPNSAVTFSQAVYELRVYVVNAPAGGLAIELVAVHRHVNTVGGTTCLDTGQPLPRKVDTMIFVNEYRRNHPVDATNGAFAVSKQVTGLFADLTQTFTFDVVMTASALCPANTTFVARRVNAAGTQVGANITFTSGVSQAVVLGHNERLIFDGPIAVGSTFDVTERAADAHIASVEVIANGVTTNLANTAVNQPRPTGTHIVGPERNAANFTNAHQAPVATGLVITSAPLYALIFGTGLALSAFVAQRTRKRIEELPFGGAGF